VPRDTFYLKYGRRSRIVLAMRDRGTAMELLHHSSTSATANDSRPVGKIVTKPFKDASHCWEKALTLAPPCDFLSHIRGAAGLNACLAVALLVLPLIGNYMPSLTVLSSRIDRVAACDGTSLALFFLHG